MDTLSRSTAVLLSILFLACSVAQSASPAATPIATNAAAVPLGSAAFLPTPEQPVGWRGDWTGRYPGATPPIEWSRRVKGSTTELKYQGRKPAAGGDKDAVPLDYFTIKDWLVAGPFDAHDSATAIDTDFLAGETTVQPDEGDKAGPVTWKFTHNSMETQTSHVHNEGMLRHLNVDFVFAFGKFSRDEKHNYKVEGDFTNKVAYAHTYIYAPAAGEFQLMNLNWGSAAKAWLNGKPLKVEVETNRNTWNKKEVDVTLNKGWNRLLIKVASGENTTKTAADIGMSDWRTVSYILPAGPVTYETKNITWMTRVTGRSMSQPIVVGDRIFFGSGISDLMCVNKADGKVLWIHSNTPWDGLSTEERAQYKGQIEPLVTQLEKLNAEAVTAINAMVSSQGMSSDQQTVMDKRLKEKYEFESKIHKEFYAIDRKRFPPMFGNEVSSSNGAPCSDGKHVYWVCGGGMKGPGASVVCCFDFSGKRVWSYHEAFGAAEHGLHTSALLSDGKLIYAAAKWLVCFDAATGKIIWRQKCEEFCGASPQRVRIGNEYAVLSKHDGRYVDLRRVSDGTMFASFDTNLFGEETPVVENGVVFVPDRFKGWGNDNVAFTAIQLPSTIADKTVLKPAFELNWERDHMPLRGISFWVASPLYVDGIVYVEDMSGGLMAVDVKQQKTVYKRWLDWYARYDRYLYGAVASPTLGGKNIYLIDDAGSTIILKPGPVYQEIGRNIIENISPSTQSGNPCKLEAFYSSPVFCGNAIYVKGEEYLYAIEAKK